MESCAQESERFGRPLCAGLPKWSQGRPNQLAHLGRARLSGRARIPPAGQPAQLNSTRLGSSPTIGQTSWRQARGWRALVASGARAGGRGRRLRAEQEATRPPHRKASGGGECGPLFGPRHRSRLAGRRTRTKGPPVACACAAAASRSNGAAGQRAPPQTLETWPSEPASRPVS